VTLTTNAPPDGIAAVATSYDATLAYGAQTPFSDQLAFHWVGSLWEYDAQHDSLITVGNGGTKPALAALTLYYNPGAQTYEMQQTLQPGDQMWVDVGKLVREHIPDKNGNFLPANVSSGTYEIRDLTNQGVGQLFEGKVVLDKTYGHAAYGCAECCAYKPDTIGFLYQPLCMQMGSGAQQFVQGYNLCGGQYEDVSSNFYNHWSTADTSIATVNGYGNHTGVGVGSTTSQTSGSLDIYESPAHCPLLPWQPQGPTCVKPTISGPNTLWWFNGLTLGVSGYPNQITLTANSGGNGTTYQWNIATGSDKISLSTSTSASVQVTSIGQSTTANDASVTVTVGGVTSNPFTLTVRAPWTFGTDPAHQQPAYGSDPTYVWETVVYNIVLDNLLTPLPSSINVNENWTTAVVADYSGTNWRQPTPNSTGCVSIVNAELGDGIFGEVPSRIPTPVYNVSQNGAAVQHWGQEWRIGTCTAGSGPRVETNTLQKYTDHAAYTGVTTPAP
jgi:hypothetical protein